VTSDQYRSKGRGPEVLQTDPLFLYREKLLAAGHKLIDLSFSNPSQAGLFWEKDTWMQFNPVETSQYSPDPQGPWVTRKAICEYYKEIGADIDPEQIVLTASTSEAYGLCFKTFMQKDDEVLVLTPGYPLISEIAFLEGFKVSSCPLTVNFEEGSWTLPWKKLKNSISTHTRILALVHPSNPLGNVFDLEQIEKLCQFAQAEGLILIIDEVFLDFPHREKGACPTFAQIQDTEVYILGGVSKACLAPQVKLGWIVVAGWPKQGPARRDHLVYVNDAYLSLSVYAAQISIFLLKNKTQLVETLQGRLESNEKELQLWASGRSLKVFPRRAGWYVVLSLAEQFQHLPDRSGQISRQCMDAGVWVHPGYLFDLPGTCLVISLLTPEIELRKGLKVLGNVQALA